MTKGSMPHKLLMDAAKKEFGDRLKIQKHPFVTSVYLDEVKRGRGFFWIYTKITKKGYRVQFQKVKEVLEMVETKGYGGYPMKYLRNNKQIDEFVNLFKLVDLNYENRYKISKTKNSHKDLSKFLDD